MALPVYQGSGAAVSAGNADINPAWPTHVADYIGVIRVETAGGSSAPTAPSGYTEHPSSPIVSAGTNSTRISFFGKRTAVSNESAPTVSGTSPAQNHVLARIDCYSGCPTTGNWYDHFYLLNSGVVSTASTAVSVAGGTTPENDCLVILVLSRGTDLASTTEFSSWVSADLANLAEQNESGTASGNGGGLVLVTGEKAAAGTVGTTTATLANAAEQAWLLFAVRPVSSAVNATGAPALPALTGAGTGTVDLASTGAPALPSLIGAGTATVEAAASGAPTLPALTGAGTSTVEVAASGAPVLPALTGSGEGTVEAASEISATGALVLPALTGAGTGTVSVSASGTPVLPLIIAFGTATVPLAINAQGAPLLPALIGSGTGLGGVLPVGGCWAFSLHGHVFYVLSTIKNGHTYVYDVATKQWHRWYTAPQPWWNMLRGTTWGGRIIAAGAFGNSIWELDPGSSVDEDALHIPRAVTGFMPVRGDDARRQGALRVNASVGAPVLEGAEISLRFSDDLGSTWQGPYVVELGDDPEQVVEFRSLGRLVAPGRLWELSDTGGTVRIDDVDSDLEGP